MQKKQFDDKFHEVHDLIRLAEHEIKHTEGFSNKLSIPSVNQLRYASSHLSKAAISTEDEVVLRELDEAGTHATRAIIDAIEIRALHVLKELELFNKDYRLITISKYVPDYPALLSTAEEIRSILQMAQDDLIRTSANRELSTLTDELHRGISKANANRDILNQKLNLLKRRNGYWIVLSSAGLIISILGIVVSIGEKVDIDKTPEIQNEIENLDNIKESLQFLEEYVQDQIEHLSSLDLDIETLKKEKNELDQIISTNQDIVQSIIERYESQQPQYNWMQMLISFLIGMFSSLTVVLLTNYLLRIRARN